ncbi:MAG: calcium/sodium antiporter [Tyzzerella sp.]|nr:calcium/sodium antiporter [Tyzzerella sp.]
MIVVSLIKLIIGFLLLVKGADYFVEGASSIARKLRIPTFVIGLTIVAFGTSAPELAVSVSAAIKGSNDIAIGNVVGSNIFNTLVVLGASAVITPIAVEKGIIKKDYPLSIFAAILLGVLSLDMILFKAPAMTLGRVDGIILLVAFAFFMYTTVKAGLKQRAAANLEHEEALANMHMPTWKSILILVLGLAGIVIGGDLSVDGAKEIARVFGLSEALIGLTIVAVGTSLPELVTSIVAARKGESDIAVGNAIGSNIFNIFFILGVSATILPMNVSSTYLYDIAVLSAVMVLSYIPIAKTKKVSRGMGITMVAAYLAYTVYLIMR